MKFTPIQGFLVSLAPGLLALACGGRATTSDGSPMQGAPDPKQPGTATAADGGLECPMHSVAMGGACLTLPPEDPCPNAPMTQFDGDSQCLPVPAPDVGMQLHYGPANYDDPDLLSKFTIAPGDETVDCMFVRTPNVADVHVGSMHIRIRPGGARVTAYTQPQMVPDSTVPEACNQGTVFEPIVSATALSTDVSIDGAPEYAGIALRFAARSEVALQAHFVNTTDQPRLKETWINLPYKPEAEVTREARPINWLGGVGMNIPPHTHALVPCGAAATTEVTACTAPPAADAPILLLQSDFHAHTTRLSAFIDRANGVRDAIYEDYARQAPFVALFDSATQNPVPDASTTTSGAASGILSAHPGDRISWECDVQNDTDAALRFSDSIASGETCNLFGYYAPASAPWDCISL